MCLLVVAVLQFRLSDRVVVSCVESCLDYSIGAVRLSFNKAHHVCRYTVW